MHNQASPNLSIPRRNPLRWVAWICLALGLALTLLAWRASLGSNVELAQNRFKARTDELHAAMVSRMLAYTQVLRGAQAFVSAVGYPGREDWARLHTTLRIEESYPGIAAFAFIRAASSGTLGSLLADALHDEPQFAVRPPGERPEHAVVTTIEPRSPANLRALGSDSWAHPERRQTLQSARDSGENRITGKLSLVIDDPQKPQAGFLMYQPVYRGDALPASLEERQRLLLGFITGGFRIAAVLQGTLGEIPGDVALRLFDAESADEKTLFFASHPDFDFTTAAHHDSRQLHVGGRTWTIVYAPLPSREDVRESAQSSRLLAGGVIVSLLLFAIAWSLAATRARALQLAQRMTHSLHESETKLRALFAQAPLGIWTINQEGRVIDCNEKFAEYAGAPREKIIGFNMLEDAQDTALIAPLKRALAGETVSFESEYTSSTGQRSGHYHYRFQPVDVNGRFAFVLAFAEDIGARKMAEARISHLAHHDTLTGLANRSLLKDRLQQAIIASRRSEESFALLFLDLDHFKTINDTVGHSAGDALLVEVAKRLRANVRGADTLARIGGDEFVILLNAVGSVRDCAMIADKIIAALAQPILIENATYNVTASLGIALWPDDGEDAEALTRSADVAMYHAKNNGRNNYQFFTADMNARAFEALAMEAALRNALARDEFCVHFQAQIDYASQRVIGAEALVRWQHPELGLVPPVKFIPIAEERGLISRLGDWVLHATCRQQRAWLDAGLALVPVAVNISPLQFKEGALRDSVVNALQQSGLPPRYLVLEITESAVMDDVESAIVVLRELREMGVAIEIDDFGTGYSSLSYLKRLPIHRLKIDQSFVRDVPGNGDDAAIVGAIIHLAQNLKLSVIAEGVETQEQAEFLCEQGCQAMQGYLFSRPETAELFEALLTQHAVSDPENQTTGGVVTRC